MLFGSMLRAILFLISLIIFVIGGMLFMVGMLMRIDAVYYSGIALVSIPLPIVCYLAWTRTGTISSVEQNRPEYVYRNPGMKYNKSDSDLHLTAESNTITSTATADDGTVFP